MRKRREKGQALVEAALGLPILLILLVGAYASTRTAILRSRAESASFTEALRIGRNLPGIERDLSRSILPVGETVDVRSDREGKSRLLPAPFPLLAGKTAAAAEVRYPWREIGNPRWLATANILQKTELDADCWGKATSSGKSVRRWIRGFVLLGAIR